MGYYSNIRLPLPPPSPAVSPSAEETPTPSEPPAPRKGPQTRGLGDDDKHVTNGLLIPEPGYLRGKVRHHICDAELERLTPGALTQPTPGSTLVRAATFYDPATRIYHPNELKC